MKGNSRSVRSRNMLLIGVGAAALATPQLALAQTTASEAQVSADKADDNLIIVTASRREQDVRSIPANVTAIGGDALEDSAATGFEDYIATVPGVQFNDSGGSQTGSVSIRGVSTDTLGGITQQTVGIYIDEIPFSDVFSFLSSPDLTPFDLERVEVLRGPQGALYGSGSMGGAIRFVTAKPELGEFSGKYNGALSFIEDGDVNTLNQAMLNVPLGETLAFRGVVSYRTDSGFVDNALTGVEDSDGLDQLHLRGALRWEPTDRLALQGSFTYQNTEVDSLSGFQDPTGQNPVNTASGPSELDLKYQIANLTAEYEFDFADLLISGSFAGKERRTSQDQGPGAALGLLAGFDFALSGALGPIGAYNPGDLFVAGAGVTQNFLETQPESDAYFMEVRLTSPADQPFRWMVGGLYSDYDNENPIQQIVPGLNSALSTFTIPPPFDGLFGVGDAAALFGVGPNDQLLDFLQVSDAREWALYGEVGFDITEQLEFTLGGRYFDFSVDTQLLLSGSTLADIENSESKFQPRATLSYRANDDVLAYFVFSRGYRVGGVNDSIGLSLTPGETLDDAVAPLTYDTDDLTNYEIGIKTEWLDGDLIVDVGAYYIDWSDIQLSSFFAAPASPSGGVAAISNVGEASIYGVEAQAVLRASDNLTLRSSIAWNDAELDEASPVVQNFETFAFTSAPAGTQLPGSREWQISNAAILSGPFLGTEASLTLQHQYFSSTINDFAIRETLSGYHLVDVILDLELNEAIRLGAFARNLFDEREAVSFIPSNAAFALPRSFTFTRPRTVGVNLSLEF